MGIRGYLVLTEPGAAAATALRIAALPGCEALPAERHDVLLLVTETEDAADDGALRERVEAIGGVNALVLTFAETVPEAAVATRPSA
jgi:hypothetical protein